MHWFCIIDQDSTTMYPHSAPSWILNKAENPASPSLQDGATKWHYSDELGELGLGFDKSSSRAIWLRRYKQNSLGYFCKDNFSISSQYKWEHYLLVIRITCVLISPMHPNQLITQSKYQTLVISNQQYSSIHKKICSDEKLRHR